MRLSLNVHNQEEYFPEDPMSFVRASRFRHHRGGFWGDQGWSKSRNKWVSGNSHEADFYDIPVALINSYRLWPDGRNRRPRDGNAGNKLNVFIEPQGHRTGLSDPNGKVPAFYHSFNAPHGSGLFLIIKYWIFHGYSDGSARFNHQGDWEGVAVAINTSLQPEFVSYAAHGDYTRIPWRDVLTQNGRPLSYVEKGTPRIFTTDAGGTQEDMSGISHRLLSR